MAFEPYNTPLAPLMTSILSYKFGSIFGICRPPYPWKSCVTPFDNILILSPLIPLIITFPACGPVEILCTPGISDTASPSEPLAAKLGLTLSIWHGISCFVLSSLMEADTVIVSSDTSVAFSVVPRQQSATKLYLVFIIFPYY